MLLELRWSPRREPLEPEAVLALGQGAGSLARRALAMPEQEQGQLRALAAPGVLVLLGPAQVLPWVDGARYLAPEPCAPGLWLPSSQGLWPHPALVLRRLERSAPTPLALWPGGEVFPLGDARPLWPRALRAWLDTGEEA